MHGLAKTVLARTLFPCAGLLLVLAPAQAEEPVKPYYSGSLQTTYDYRRLGGYSDQDVSGYWWFRGRNLSDKRVEVYTSGRAHADIDGTGSGFGDDPFLGLGDASSDEFRLYQFYIDVHDQDRERSLRAGRQYVDVADYIQMDGLQAMLYESDVLGGRVFFGRPVSYYSSTSRDLFGGLSLVGRPWEGNQSRATYARYQDDSANAADDHFFFDVRQRVTDGLRTRGYLSIMNNDVRMGGADLFFASLEEKEFDAVAGARRWGRYDARTRAYSPLLDVLGDQEPYTMGYGRCTAQMLSWFYLSPGVMVKQPDESDATNRRFERYDVDFIVQPSESLSASVAVEYWNVEQDDSFFGLSGDIRYRHEKTWEASLGAAYLDYSYSRLADYSVFTDDNLAPPLYQPTITPLDGTRVDVSPYAFTYFLRGKWNVTKRTSLHIAGEIEDDSEESDLGYRLRTSLEVRL